MVHESMTFVTELPLEPYIASTVPGRMSSVSCRCWLPTVNVDSTYWYLTATPELLRLASGRLDRKKKEVAR